MTARCQILFGGSDVRKQIRVPLAARTARRMLDASKVRRDPGNPPRQHSGSDPFACPGNARRNNDRVEGVDDTDLDVRSTLAIEYREKPGRRGLRFSRFGQGGFDRLRCCVVGGADPPRPDAQCPDEANESALQLPLHGRGRNGCAIGLGAGGRQPGQRTDVDWFPLPVAEGAMHLISA